MKPLLIRTRRFPPRNYHAITLFPFILYKGKALTRRDLRHETVHLWQQLVYSAFKLNKQGDNIQP